MIAQDIAFYQPETIQEALSAWTAATESGKRPRYFSGGTELITRARERSTEFDVLIDIKRIPECQEFAPDSGIIGGATRLSDLADQDEMPLVARAAAGIADQTTRNSVTAGGNVLSQLPYRELLMPLLLFDADVVVADPASRDLVVRPIRETYRKRLLLDPGAFVVRFEVAGAVGVEGYYARRTKDARIDYPIASVAMVWDDEHPRFVVGGAYGCPVRLDAAEAALASALASVSKGDNLASALLTTSPVLPGTDRANASVADARAVARLAADRAIREIPDRIWDDMRASSEYRRETVLQLMSEGLLVLATSKHRGGGDV